MFVSQNQGIAVCKPMNIMVRHTFCLVSPNDIIIPVILDYFSVDFLVDLKEIPVA